MRKFLVLAAATAAAFTAVSIPTFASAQSWRSDPCRAQQNRAERNGTIAGGVLGAVIGSQVAGRGDRTEGAVIGGALGAGVGNRVGHSSVSCTSYPRGYRRHGASCRWVKDRSSGRTRSYEVCRGRDGYWRRYRG